MEVELYCEINLSNLANCNWIPLRFCRLQLDIRREELPSFGACHIGVLLHLHGTIQMKLISVYRF